MTIDRDGFNGTSEEDLISEYQLDEERLAEAWDEYENWLRTLDQSYED